MYMIWSCFFSVGGYKLGKLLIEGKTKQVFELPDEPKHCILLNKDRITAGDGVKAHDLEGKAAISNQTNAKVFEILKSAGKCLNIQTSLFVADIIGISTIQNANTNLSNHIPKIYFRHSIIIITILDKRRYPLGCSSSSGLIKKI